MIAEAQSRSNRARAWARVFRDQFFPGHPTACLLAVSLIVWTAVVPAARAQVPRVPTAPTPGTESLADALSPASWEKVEKSVDKGLAWLAQRQAADGSFEGPAGAQPGITSLAVMAFLSKGHLPGNGPYGAQLEKGIEFALRCQRQDGLFTLLDPNSGRSSQASKSGSYSHGITGLMLTEAYGMTDGAQAEQIKPAVVKALKFTRQLQMRPKVHPEDRGGWRYLHGGGSYSADSDLSVTGWQLMFLRSARNAEFEVPKAYVDDAVQYVLGCWDAQQKVFYYTVVSGDRRWSRAMVGVGILSLAMAGQHQTRIAQEAGNTLLRLPFDEFGEQVGSGERFFYSTYYCSQAMAQLGGRHWKQFFPTLANTLVGAQRSNGAWPAEPYGGDHVYGNVYTTAMAILSLTPPLQLLPVYQR